MTGPVNAGLVGEALAAIDEARMHSYSPEGAFGAAMAHLDGASAEEASAVAAVLATWIATELNPTMSTTDLGSWLAEVSSIVVGGRT